MSSSLHQFQLGTSRPRIGGARSTFYFPPQYNSNVCPPGYTCMKHTSSGPHHECPVNGTYYSKPICPSGCGCVKQK